MLFIYFQESLVALTLDNKLPLETRFGFCAVFLSMGDLEPALDQRVKLWRLGTCVMNSRPSDAGSPGYFINPEAQCSSITKAPLLGKPQTNTKTNSQLQSAQAHLGTFLP